MKSIAWPYFLRHKKNVAQNTGISKQPQANHLFNLSYFKNLILRENLLEWVVLQVSQEQQIYQMSSSGVITSFAGPCTFLQFSWKLKHTLPTELDKWKKKKCLREIRSSKGLLKNADTHLKHLNLLVYRPSWLLCKCFFARI